MAARRVKWKCAAEFSGAGRCVGPAYLTCGSCGAPSYCSRRHQVAHWEEHKNECSRMAQQMARAGDLHDFPFAFRSEATRLVDEGAVTTCLFLEKRELHLKEWQLPFSMCPCTDPSEAASELLKDWTDYYSWRQLPLDSPVALLLHWPLTLYHAFGLVSRCKPTHKMNIGTSIRVHYLGPQKELQILHVFAELMALLPNSHVHIDMIGPAVPASRDGEVVELGEYPKCLDPQCMCKQTHKENVTSLDKKVEGDCLSPGYVTLKLWRGLYHDRHLDLVSAPHFVVAANAGIPAFASWQPTIKLLSRLKVPTIFTDYCEEAADLAAQAVSLVHPEQLTYPVQANPFRQPFSAQDKLLNLPTFSNCFMFGIN